MTSDLLHKWPAPLQAYQPLQVLSTGQTSTVVRATTGLDKREVALKIVHPHLANDQPLRRRLRREFAAVRRLTHPAVVRAEQLIDDGPTLALVMEYVAGQSVRHRVQHQGPLDWAQARPVIDDILAALAQAHRRGILHRDITADHILIDANQQGRIIGFGMARVDELVALTMHTQVLGSLESMAPERVLGLAYDGRADLYSVGAVAHEMLLGYPPVEPTMAAAFANAQHPPDATEQHWADSLPDPARYLLERSLVGDPAARFATAEQMRRALDGVYDPHLWHDLVTRETRSCPACETPVLHGLDQCLACGFEFRRLVQHPGAGDFLIKILSPRQTHEPDFWFEINDHPDYLPDKASRALMDLLDAHEDTRSVVHWNPEYRWPPYALLTDLDAADSRRISELLEQRQIPHEILIHGRPLEKEEEDEAVEQDPLDREMKEVIAAGIGSAYTIFLIIGAAAYFDVDNANRSQALWIMGIFVVLPLILAALVFFASQLGKMERSTFAALAMATIILGILLTIALLLSIPTVIVIAAALAFLLAFFTVGFASTRLRRQTTTDDHRHQAFGLPLMIPTDALTTVELSGQTVQMPRQTSRVLSRCQDRAVRQELQDLLVLAIAVTQRSKGVDPQAFANLTSEILNAGGELDRLCSEADHMSTAELYRQAEALQAAVAEAEAAGEARQADEKARQLQQVLEALEAQDLRARQITRCRTSLQMARGAMLDLLSDHPQDHSPSVFSLASDADDAFDQLARQLEARQEVAQLLVEEVAP